jgi:hypothetical protein
VIRRLLAARTFNISPVRKIAVPPAARALSTLAHIDYEDAFLVDVGALEGRTAEQWARAILDDAPESLRLRLWAGWMMLGLRLGAPGSKRHVLGWEIRDKSPDFVLLGARSRVGMPAEILVKREPDGLLLDVFVQKNNPIARAVWAAIQPAHERIVPALLRQLSRRVHGGSEPIPSAQG